MQVIVHSIRGGGLGGEEASALEVFRMRYPQQGEQLHESV
jgi:hypothetical protein